MLRLFNCSVSCEESLETGALWEVAQTLMVVSTAWPPFVHGPCAAYGCIPGGTGVADLTAIFWTAHLRAAFSCVRL